MKSYWNWFKKYILWTNNNIKSENGLNKLYYDHKLRGTGTSDSIRKTFYLKNWIGPFGEVKYFYESGQLETLEIWEEDKKLGTKMIKHIGYNEDGSLKDGQYEEYLSEFDIKGLKHEYHIGDKRKGFWGPSGSDDYVLNCSKVITTYFDGRLIK